MHALRARARPHRGALLPRRPVSRSGGTRLSEAGGMTVETPKIATAKVVWASEVEREQVEWLDPKSRFIPKRAITVLAGMPGLGKSMYSLLIAAKLSREG